MVDLTATILKPATIPVRYHPDGRQAGQRESGPHSKYNRPPVIRLPGQYAKWVACMRVCHCPAV